MSELSGLPIGWSLVLLKEVTTNIVSVDPTCTPTLAITYFDIGSIDSSVGVASAPKLIVGGVAPSRARQRVQEGDVLFSTVRPYLRAIARVPRNTSNGVASTGFCVLRGEDGVSSGYLFYLARSESFIKALEPLQRGTSYPAVRDGDVLGQYLPLAPSAEQRRIVEKLEELLSDLDAGVAELRTAQAKLKVYRQSLLKAAFNGELTSEWRKRRCTTGGSLPESGIDRLRRILKARNARWDSLQSARVEKLGKAPAKVVQAKFPEPVKPIDEQPSLPTDWTWTHLGQCFRVEVGATPSRKEPAYWDGDVPWVSSGEVQFSQISKTRESITAEGLLNSSTRINPRGSVMLGMIGEGKTRGQVAVLDIEAANNQNCAAVWVSETDIPSMFVYFWLWSRYDETRRGSSGNNQPALNKTLVELIPMPLPPVDECDLIAELVSYAFDKATEQELSIDLVLRKSEAQRQNILKAAFSGQLVPQDPNDEPASVLLERILASRAENPRKPSRRSSRMKEPA